MLCQTIKNKYEAIFGFVTIVISLSAFKDELAKVSVDLHFIKFNLAEYFLWVIYAFCLCLYLYVMEHRVRETAIGSWKFFDWMTRLGFFIFVLALSSPVLILLMLGFTNLVLWLGNVTINQNYPDLFRRNNTWLSILSSAIAIAISIFTKIFSDQFYTLFKANKIDKAEEDELLLLTR